MRARSGPKPLPPDQVMRCLAFRFTMADVQMMKAAARRAGAPNLSAWVRPTLLRAARAQGESSDT